MKSRQIVTVKDSENGPALLFRRSPTLALTLKIASARQAGQNVISRSTPTFPTPESIALAPLALGQRLTAPEGDPVLRDEARTALFGRWTLPEYRLFIAAGAKAALFAVLRSLPGGSVLVPAPAWPSYDDIVRLAGHRPEPVWTEFAEAFALDPAVLAARLRDTGAVAVLLANPGNPTGRIHTAAELEGALAACAAMNAVLVLDESFSEIMYDGAAWLLSVRRAHPDLIVVNSFSKNHHLQGQRVADCLLHDSRSDDVIAVHQTLISSAPGLGQAAAVQTRRAGIAQTIVAEVGKAPAEATDEVDYALTFLHHALASVSTTPEPAAGRRLRIVPAGPALAITPYNDPLAGIVRKIAPAIAAGCPVVVKPSALGPLTAQALSDAMGDTRGAVAMVNHVDRAVLGRLIADPGFRVLSFTGSTETGRMIAAQAGLKRLVPELGGNNPFLVLDGADIDRAAADAVARKTRAAGQAGSAQNRIYVVASLIAAFRTAFLDRLSAVTFGPSDAGVAMGPRRARLKQLAQGGTGFGTQVGHAPGAFRPVVPDQDMPLRHAEAFGPLVPLCRVPDRQAALAMATAEDQALVCYIYRDVTPTELTPLRFGSLGLNSTSVQGADVPTGGFGPAGVGREGGLWGLREYQTTINERWG